MVNYTPVARSDYRVGVPKKKQYKLIMNEHGLLDKPVVYKAEKKECDNREYSFAYPLPPYGVAVFCVLILVKVTEKLLFFHELFTNKAIAIYGKMRYTVRDWKS